MIWLLAILIGSAGAGLLYYFLIFDRSSVYDRAMRLAKNGNYTDARGLIRSRVDREPDNPKAQYAMAEIYHMEGNPDQELLHLEEIKKMRKLPPELSAVQILNRIGGIYYAKEEYTDSFENYLEVLKYSGGNEDALAHLAFMAIGQGQFDVAERYFRTLVKTAPNSPEYRLARGIGLAMLKNRDAIKELEMALTLSPTDSTARFFCALQSFRTPDYPKAVELIDLLLTQVTDTYILYLVNRLACVCYFQLKDFQRSLTHAERCLMTAISENWDTEEYDSRLAISYMSMYLGNLEKANENLLELEIRNPTDQLVMRISDFRMDLEEGAASLEAISPRGFDFTAHMQDWVRGRFPEDAIFKLSGLFMEDEIDILKFFTREGEVREKSARSQLDPEELIARFNALRDNAFIQVCENIISMQGFKLEKVLPFKDKDGLDFAAHDKNDKKVKALFRIRKWKNQPISDIFLRDLQNYMNEQKMNLGFMLAGTSLTPGAETALQNLKKIRVINEYDLAEVLTKAMK